MFPREIESFRMSSFLQWVRENEIRLKTIQSSVALGMGTAFEGVMRFLRTMVIAKVLLPDQVGLIALLLATTQVFEGMTEVGVNMSIIQNKKSHQKEFLNMAWWFQLIRGFGLYLVAFFAAPLIAHFFDEPRMAWMLRITFLMVPLKSMMSPRAYLLEKDLRYFTYMALYQGSVFVGMSVLVTLLLIWKNVYAWVVGFTVEFALLAILSYFFCPFLPTFSFDKESFSEILRFARGMLGLPFLVFVAFQADIFVLGKIVSRDWVGMYAMAVILARIPRELFMKVVGRLMLPVFSRCQDAVDQLRQMFLKVIHATALLTFPITGFLIGCSGPVLTFTFKAEYVRVSGPFIILCMVMLLRVQSIVLTSIYMATGKPHLQRLFVAIRAGVLGVIIFPCVFYGGLIGAASAVLASELIGFLIQLCQIRKLLRLSFSDFFERYKLGFYATSLFVFILSMMILIIPGDLLLYLSLGLLFLIPLYVFMIKKVVFICRDQMDV